MSGFSISYLDLMDRSSESAWADLANNVIEDAFISTGAGSAFSPYAVTTREFDRFGYNASPINNERPGHVFMTRPRLNLMTENIRGDRPLQSMDTLNPMSPNFAIRCLLDPVFASYVGATNIRKLAEACPYFDVASPFVKVITNNLTSFSGGNDLVMDTFTFSPGLMNEEMTIPIGSDLGTRSIDLSVTIRDLHGGFVFALMFLWLRWIALALKGVVVAYPDDIYQQRMPYTVSFYRFTMDAVGRTITGFQKFTGCFPKSLSLGSRFNISTGQFQAPGATEVQVTFQANVCTTFDPNIFVAFNTLAKRYNPLLGTSSAVELGYEGYDNYMGYPYIIATQDKPNHLGWYFTSNTATTGLEAAIRNGVKAVPATTSYTPANTRLTTAESTYYDFDSMWVTPKAETSERYDKLTAAATSTVATVSEKIAKAQSDLMTALSDSNYDLAYAAAQTLSGLAGTESISSAAKAHITSLANNASAIATLIKSRQTTNTTSSTLA